MRVSILDRRKSASSKLTISFSSFARPPVDHACLTHPSLWICQLVGIAMPFVCADVDVSCPRRTPRSLDALPGVNTGTVVDSCSRLGSFALNISLGGHFACGVCNWAGSLHRFHCDDSEYFANPRGFSSRVWMLTACSGSILDDLEDTTPQQRLREDHEPSFSH
jgi:hypothetical protein